MQTLRDFCVPLMNFRTCAGKGFLKLLANFDFFKQITNVEVQVNHKLPWWAFVLPATMSLIALADLPYGYYQFLRIVVTGCAFWIALDFYRRKSLIGAAVFGIMAIIFNPIEKIHMERNVHAIFNVISAVTLLGALWLQSRWKGVT